MSKVVNRTSLVDVRSVTIAGKVTALATKKRNKRLFVTGGHGLEVNEAGKFFRAGHAVHPHGNGKYNYLIYPGRNYSGPVWPAYGNMFGQYLADPDDGRTRKANRKTVYDRVAAELVAYEFLGPPPESWEFVTVAHLDGDRNNCHRNNLVYVVNEQAVEQSRRTGIRALMRGPATGARLQVRARDPFGTKSRNPYAADLYDNSKRREGADLTRNPPYLPDKPRTLERAS